MEPVPETADPSAYLRADDVIDHGHPQVLRTAALLRAGAPGPYEYAEAAYTYVRDEVPHTFDSGDDRVSLRASEVLATRNGICYAKSHALVALLRAEGIPAGLCYQRLADDGGGTVLHGLIALLLPGTGRWARQDPRGNKPGVDARFRLDREQLAFPVRPAYGERDYPAVYAAPPAPVLAALRGAGSRTELAARLPTGLP
ncbi:transglutaminase-like domain-containing protein [Actinacidiphila sp. bgisy144]|uniref:transglutaminase-like domain-containing protein n=1 Tax=Actinacidiphila sp. bgisy144 TaxID=3413791 RepID=UPI003EC0AC94